MIPVAGIEDQELAIITERPSKHDPAVARGRDLTSVPGRNGEAPFGPPEPVRSPKFPDSDAINRQRQLFLGQGKGDGRREPPGVLAGLWDGSAIQRLFFVSAPGGD